MIRYEGGPLRGYSSHCEGEVVKASVVVLYQLVPAQLAPPRPARYVHTATSLIARGPAPVVERVR